MKKYTYKTKDGKIIQSNEVLKDKDLTLVREIKNMQMTNITQK